MRHNKSRMHYDYMAEDKSPTKNPRKFALNHETRPEHMTASSSSSEKFFYKPFENNQRAAHYTQNVFELNETVYSNNEINPFTNSQTGKCSSDCGFPDLNGRNYATTESSMTPLDTEQDLSRLNEHECHNLNHFDRDHQPQDETYSLQNTNKDDDYNISEPDFPISHKLDKAHGYHYSDNPQDDEYHHYFQKNNGNLRYQNQMSSVETDDHFSSDNNIVPYGTMSKDLSRPGEENGYEQYFPLKLYQRGISQMSDNSMQNSQYEIYKNDTSSNKYFYYKHPHEYQPSTIFDNDPDAHYYMDPESAEYYQQYSNKCKELEQINEIPDNVSVTEKVLKRKYVRRKTHNLQEIRDEICADCKSITTPLWRRVNGRIVCNACGLYFKIHGIRRPPHLSKRGIITRKKRSQKHRSSHCE